MGSNNIIYHVVFFLFSNNNNNNSDWWLYKIDPFSWNGGPNLLDAIHNKPGQSGFLDYTAHITTTFINVADQFVPLLTGYTGVADWRSCPQIIAHLTEV